MKEILAKDSIRLVVYDSKMKYMTFTEMALRSCLVIILLFLVLGISCLIPNSSYEYIDNKGPIVGFVLVMGGLSFLGIRWFIKQIKG